MAGVVVKLHRRVSSGERKPICEPIGCLRTYAISGEAVDVLIGGELRHLLKIYMTLHSADVPVVDGLGGEEGDFERLQRDRDSANEEEVMHRIRLLGGFVEPLHLRICGPEERRNAGVLIERK